MRDEYSVGIGQKLVTASASASSAGISLANTIEDPKEPKTQDHWSALKMCG